MSEEYYEEQCRELQIQMGDLEEENANLRSDISHLNTEITSLNEQLVHMRGLLDKAEAANYHEKLREAIQAERKRWAKEDAEALRVRDIEQQINGVNWFSEKHCDDEHSFLADKAIEQLRKELEK